MFTREQRRNKTEKQLAKEIIKQTKDYDQVLLLCSTTNIDRIITMQKVADKTNKTLVHDIILSNVLTLIQPPIPHALTDNRIRSIPATDTTTSK